MKKTMKEHLTSFYERHPEKKTMRIVCPDCGLEYGYSNKTKHMKTKLHRLLTEAKKI